MKTIFRRKHKIAIFTGLLVMIAAISALVSYLAPRANALGVPATNPLYYSGILVDTNGKPLSVQQTIEVKLYDAETGGNNKCTTAPALITPMQGRFRIALDATCITAIRDNSDLWTEIKVGNTTLPRSKIGAAPYIANPDIHKGNVGIGMSNPLYTLDILGGGWTQLHIKSSGGASGGLVIENGSGSSIGLGTYDVSAAGIVFGISAGSNTFFRSNASTFGIGTSDLKDLILGTNNTNRLHISGSGNIGIGTNSPKSSLDVDGELTIRNGSNKMGVLTKSTSNLGKGVEWNTGINPPGIGYLIVSGANPDVAQFSFSGPSTIKIINQVDGYVLNFDPAISNPNRFGIYESGGIIRIKHSFPNASSFKVIWYGML